MECISCIKDAKTGICRAVKDKTARELIEEIRTSLTTLETVVNGISGVEGGHLATDLDITRLENQIGNLRNDLSDVNDSVSVEVNNLQTQLDNLKTLVDGMSGSTDGLVTSEQFEALQNTVTALTVSVNNLDSTYAKDSDITSLQNTVTALTVSVNNLDSTYAKDSDITSLQTQVNNITNSVNEVIDTINTLDNTYAKDSDITTLDTRVTTLESAGSGFNYELIGKLSGTSLTLPVTKYYKGFIIQYQSLEKATVNSTVTMTDSTIFMLTNTNVRSTYKWNNIVYYRSFGDTSASFSNANFKFERTSVNEGTITYTPKKSLKFDISNNTISFSSDVVSHVLYCYGIL